MLNPTLLELFRLLKNLYSSRLYSKKLTFSGHIYLKSLLNTGLTRSGEVIRLTLDLGLTPHILEKGNWQQEVSRFVSQGAMKFSDVLVLDLGAHVGTITRQTILEMERTHIDSNVHFVCVEPNNREFANLQFNLKPFNNCSLVNLGIHPIDNEINLTPDWINSGNSTTLNHTISSYRKMKMETKQAVSLGNLLKMFESDIPIIIKSDLEGLDIAVLQNLDLANWSRIERFAVELYGHLEVDILGIHTNLENFDLFWPNSETPISLERLIEMSRDEFISSSDLYAIRKV